MISLCNFFYNRVLSKRRPPGFFVVNQVLGSSHTHSTLRSSAHYFLKNHRKYLLRKNSNSQKNGKILLLSQSIVCYAALVVLFSYDNTAHANIGAVSAAASMASSATVLMDKAKLPNTGEVNLKTIGFSISEDMNHGGAAKVHVVFAYSTQLAEILKGLSATKYFQRINQLKKDNPDKLKIMEWEIRAEARVFSYDLEKEESPFKEPTIGLVFVEYSTPGEHRSVIPMHYKMIAINFDKDDFTVDGRCS